MIKELLLELKNSKLVKVTGSYADGTETDNSDIDFYVKPDHPDWKWKQKERNIETIIKILKKFNIKWASFETGYIYSHKSNNNLPIQIEFSDRFKHRAGRLKLINILGIEFKTY